MTNTKQVIKLFEDFSIFMGFLIFQHTQKQNKKSKIKNNKRTTKQKVLTAEAEHDMMHESTILSIGSINAWT